MRKEALSQLHRIGIRANPLHIDPYLPAADNGKHCHTFRVRQVEAQIAEARIGVDGKLRLPIGRRPKSNLALFDSQIAAQSAAKQGSADKKLIAMRGEFESRRPPLFFRLKQLEQQTGFLIPRFEVDMPHVDFIVPQTAVEIAQRFWLHVSTRLHACMFLRGASLSTDSTPTR